MHKYAIGSSKMWKELNLSPQCEDILISTLKVKTIKDLTKLKISELLRIKNVGRRNVSYIEEFLAKRKLRLADAPVRKTSDGTDGTKLIKDIDALHTHTRKNLKRFNQKSLRYSIRKVLEIHALLDMQRDVRNEQGRSGSGSGTRTRK